MKYIKIHVKMDIFYGTYYIKFDEFCKLMKIKGLEIKDV